MKILLAVLVAGNAFASSIPMVGSDLNGEPAIVNVPQNEYVERLKSVLINANDSVVPFLQKREAKPGWMLRTVVVGLGVSTEIGIGPFKVGATPRSRLVFTNSSNPMVP